MKKISMIAALTTVLALFGSGLSYAAPTQAEAVLAADTSQVVLTPELVAQAISELKASEIPHETFYDTKGAKTTFHPKQGLSFTPTEPQPSVGAFLGGSWDFGGPYVLFNKFDIDAIFNGSPYMLGVGICLLPGIGWAACTAIGAVINAVTLIVNAAYKNPCGNRQLKVYLNGCNGGCV